MSSQAARAGSWAGLAWLCLPFIPYVWVLRRLWFNAPIWDDYDAVLKQTMLMLDAASPREWLGIVVMQHNEHRIAAVRLGAWTLASVTGQIDFRLMVTFGVSTVFGMAILAWAEFRRKVSAPAFAAAGFLLFQWSYYEAALMGSASLANLTVVTFSFASLFFATRAGWPCVAATVLFGVLAVGSLANGLFALPIAAAGAMFARQRSRAVLYGIVAAALWILYFTDYRSPVGHPSTLAALAQPVAAAHLFLLILGSIVPGILLPTGVGALAVIAIAWMVRRRFWQGHLTVALWILFILVSVAAMTAGRVGFGVVYAARYALYSSILAALVLLWFASISGPWSLRRSALAIAASALVCVGVSVASWTAVKAYTTNGHRLAKAIPASPDVSVQPYFGMYYPVPPEAQAKLVEAEKRGLYVPRVERVFATEVRMLQEMPAGVRIGGNLDRVVATGKRVYAGGWTDIPAIVPQRSFGVFPGEGAPTIGAVATDDRADVAMAAAHANLQFGGFHFELDYPTEDLARRAAATMCIVVEAPSAGAAILGRQGVSCPPAGAGIPPAR